MIVNTQRSEFKRTPMSTSSTQFQKTNNQKPRYNPFAQISKIPIVFQKDMDTKPKDSTAIPNSRPMTSQSMILTSSKAERKTNFSKLDGMARNTTQMYQEDPVHNLPKLQIHKLYENINTHQNFISPHHQNTNRHAYLSPDVQQIQIQQQKWPNLQPPNQRQSITLGLTGWDHKQKQAATHRTNNPQLLGQNQIQQKQGNEKSPQSTHSSKSAQTSSPNTEKRKFQFFKTRKQMTKIQKIQNFLTVPNCNQSMQQLQQFNATHPHLKAPEFLSAKSNPLPLNEGFFLDQKSLKVTAPSKSAPQPQIPHTHNLEFKKKTIKQNQVQAAKISPKVQFTLMKRSMNSTQIITAKQKRSVRFQRQIKISDFQILDKLGKGAFGDVFMAQEKTIGMICVIKKMSKQRIKDRKVQQHILRQIKIQSYLNHFNLTSLYGCFHDEKDIYLILEALPDGSLQQVKKKRKLPEKQTAAIIRQVSVGLKCMHEEYIIHRDLKPQNLFVNDKIIKIGDFGCSIYNRDLALRNTVVGCLEYSSPEQLSQEGYSDKIDSWSLGILTYELLYGRSPFESDMIKISMNKDQKAGLSELSFPESVPIEKKTRDFIENLLQENPNFRMDMDAVLKHPFLLQDLSL